MRTVSKEERQKRIEELRSKPDGERYNRTSVAHYLGLNPNMVSKLKSDKTLNCEEINKRDWSSTKEDILECYEKIKDTIGSRKCSKENTECLEYNKIIQEAANFYGEDSQKEILFEEMGELMQAISKYRRGGKRKEDKKQIFEEMADVLIMIAQMRFIYKDEGEVEQFIQYKLQRLWNKIQESKNKSQHQRNKPDEGLFSQDNQL